MVMNKKILVIPLIAALFLAGCDAERIEEEIPGNVINDSVLKANTKEEKKGIFSDYNLVEKDIPLNSIGKTVYSYGFLIVSNETSDEISFYSATTEKIIFGPVSRDSIAYQTFASSIAGGFLRVTTIEGETSVYDGLGNLLINKTKEVYTSLTVSDFISEKQAYFCDVKIDSAHRYFQYNASGEAISVATISDDEVNYDSGSTFQGIQYESLENYGHKNYHLFNQNSRYVVYDADNNAISSFTDPVADAKFLIGDYLVYQTSTKLDSNNNKYDYISSSGERYSLETYRINYLTGKSEAIAINYVFGTNNNDIKPFFNSQKVYTYAYANLRAISDKSILSSTVETYILDADGILHDNVTGIDLSKMERFGNNYYNSASQTIYNGNLEEIVILSNSNPIKNANSGLIICQSEGLYGAVNEEGIVVIPFKFSTIYSQYLSNNTALAILDGELCIVGFNASACTYNISKKFVGYTSAKYIENDSNDGVGAGIFAISGPATEGKPYPDYISLFSNEPESFLNNDLATMEVRISSALAIKQSVLSVLETESTILSSYRSSKLNISL